MLLNSLMDFIRLLLSLGVLCLSSAAQGAIQTFEDGTFSQTFHVENEVRRMTNQLMYFLDMDVNECAYNCMIHVRCKTFNYNFDQKICELVGEEFNKAIAYKAPGWSNIRPSPKVDGGYSDWKPLTSCIATCGINTTQQLYRECNNPEPQNGGKNCEGAEVKTVACDYVECPVHGGWSDWKPYAPCPTNTCGQTATQKFIQNCTNPSPLHGGLMCMTSMNTRESLQVGYRSCTPVCKVYKINVKTGNKVGAGTDSNVFVILEGEEGKTDKVYLKNTASSNPFESSEVDTFHENMKDVGRILHITVGYDDNSSSFLSAWYVESISIQMGACSITFRVNGWISEEDGFEKKSTNPTKICARSRVGR